MNPSHPSHNEGYEGSEEMKGMNVMNDKQYEGMDKEQVAELMNYLSVIAESLKSISNSLFWLLHRGEIGR